MKMMKYRRLLSTLLNKFFVLKEEDPQFMQTIFPPSDLSDLKLAPPQLLQTFLFIILNSYKNKLI